jgi:hypothetical protein
MRIRTSLFCLLLVLGCAWLSYADEPFDYFANSWGLIGLRDYQDGTRITPTNELMLASKTLLQFRIGPKMTPPGRAQTKTLLEGWLPVVLITANDGAVRYDFKLWASPLPTVKDWRAAFDWPTEGENYLNWIVVEVTDTGDAPAEARLAAQLAGKTSKTISESSWNLNAKQTVRVVLRVPFAPIADFACAGTDEDAALWLQRTTDYWRELLAKGAQFVVPEKKVMDAWRASHVYQFIANDHGVVKGGEGFYDGFYIRDGAYQVMQFEEGGFTDAARKAMESYLRSQKPDGRFESQGGELDGNGQALWALWQFYRMSTDREWLRRVYPQMQKSIAWLKQARRQAPADSPFAGLLPNAPADGENLWDKNHHIVGYDFWNLRGLLCAVDAAKELGEARDEVDFRAEAETYRQAIEAAWKRTGLPHFAPSWEKAGTHWGNTETLWPTPLFATDDPRVAATIAEVRENFGGGFLEGTIRWSPDKMSAIHPYMGSYTMAAETIRGEDEAAIEHFYWYLLHTTATHGCPEGIFFKRRFAWGDTVPHMTGAAMLVVTLRHMLLREDGDTLHLLSAVPDGWLASGQEIRVERAPTWFGTLSFCAKGTKDGVELTLDPPTRTAPKRITIHLPKSRPLLNVPAGVEVAYRPGQKVRWDFDHVVKVYREQMPAQSKPIPGLVPLPLAQKLSSAQCEMLDLSKLANTDPFTAPFGVPKPGKFLFTGLKTGVQEVGGVPFRILGPAQNNGRGLIVLNGMNACGQFPREIVLPVGAQGQRLFFLGNVTGWAPQDDGAGEWGAVGEYVIQYADGKSQVLPLITGRTADNWATPPSVSEAYVGLTGAPWHLNVLGIELRPVRVEKVVFRDLGTPASPVLVAVTLER